MPMHKLLYIEKYEAMINGAMKYSLEFDTPNEEIIGFMAYIGKSQNCDRFYIFEDSTHGDFTSNTYEWCAPGITAEKDTLQKVEKSTLKTWYDKFAQDDAVIIRDLEDIRDTETALYELLHRQGIKSLVVYPLTVKNKIIGFFGVDNPDIEETVEIKAFLSMASSYMVSMLRRRNTFFKLQKDAAIKSYQAIAQIYLSMHRVNIQTNTFETIKTHGIIEGNRTSSTSTDFQQQAWAIADATVTEDYIEEVKAFTDLATLEKRLENSIFIEHEFVGKTAGWCRHQFIVADRDAKGHILHVIYTIEIINEAKKRENHLRYLAQTDMLTGLNNRGSGEQKVKELLQQGQPGALALIDCDRFKSINDTYGHMAGDQVLIALAEAISKGIHKGDIALRLGGDEFAIFMINIADKESAQEHIQHVFDKVNKIYIPQIYDHPIHISMGVTFFHPETPMEFDRLYQQADRALYESKRTVGTIATFYDDIK